MRIGNNVVFTSFTVSKLKRVDGSDNLIFVGISKIKCFLLKNKNISDILVGVIALFLKEKNGMIPLKTTWTFLLKVQLGFYYHKAFRQLANTTYL